MLHATSLSEIDLFKSTRISGKLKPTWEPAYSIQRVSGTAGLTQTQNNRRVSGTTGLTEPQKDKEAQKCDEGLMIYLGASWAILILPSALANQPRLLSRKRPS